MPSQKVPKVISAGFLLQSGDKYLIGHPTDKTGTTKGWGILKGKVDSKDATLLDTALREFKEESGLDLRSVNATIHKQFYTSFRVKSTNKTVYVFRAFDYSGALMYYPFKCESFLSDGVTPEIDAFKWVTAQEALAIVAKSQQALFKGLL